MKKFYGEGALVLTTVIWGATFTIIKTALEDVSPMVFISMRFALASLILIPFIPKVFKNISKPTLIGGLILGLLYFIGFTIQTVGLNYTSATKSGFITGTFVVLTPLFQVMIERKAPGRGTMLGVVLVFIGLILLSSKGDSIIGIFTELGNNLNIGDVLTFICAIFFALYIVYLDIVSKKFDYMPLVFIQVFLTAIGGFISIGLFAATGIEQIRFTMNDNLIFAIAYTAILATVVTTILQTRFQKTVTPTKAAVIFSLEPIFAAIIAFIVLNERISNFGFIGCIFIFGGLLASELIDKQKNENGQPETS
ncbi:MAG: DMT family transporter [Ignavibacteriales bacterium]|nr:MAG: DMT family transporter [Ignavibacteriales bacterium]